MTDSADPEFDAIVVGSGISGGWAAKELTEKGLRVLVLERGKDIRHGRDYLGEHAPDWKAPFQGKAYRHAHQRRPCGDAILCGKDQHQSEGQRRGNAQLPGQTPRREPPLGTRLQP